MSRVLITGANGLVGSSLARRFLADGHEVRCLVRENAYRLDGLDARVIRGDVTAPGTLEPAVHDVEYIFHCAAALRARYPEEYYRINGNGTRHVMEAALRHAPGLKRLVYMSSQSAMGPSASPEPKPACIHCNPVSEYGRSKLEGEHEVLRFERKLPVTILRPPAIYGPGDRDLLVFFRCASRGFFPVLSGNSGNLIQLLFSGDLTAFCAKLLREDKLSRTIYFLSENRAFSYRELARLFGAAAGRRVTCVTPPGFLSRLAAVASENAAFIRGKAAAYNTDKYLEFKQRYWVGDPSAAASRPGFSFTPLEMGLKITYDWYTKNGWIGRK